MKLTDRTDLRPETIALYQRLERERTAIHPVLAVVGGLTLWPAVFMRFPKTALVVLFAGLLMGATQAWESPAVLTGLALSPVALACGMKGSKKAAANDVVLSGTVLPTYHR
jgi:hypothetical protein